MRGLVNISATFSLVEIWDTESLRDLMYSRVRKYRKSRGETVFRIYFSIHLYLCGNNGVVCIYLVMWSRSYLIEGGYVFIRGWICISIGNEAWTWRNQTCITHLRTARGHMTRRRRPQNFGKTLILKHICQKTRIRCFVAVCLAAPRSFVCNCRRSSQGVSK